MSDVDARYLGLTANQLAKIATDLQAENAELREFLSDLADHIKSDDGFGLDRGWLLDRLRELGIEVSNERT